MLASSLSMVRRKRRDFPESGQLFLDQIFYGGMFFQRF